MITEEKINTEIANAQAMIIKQGWIITETKRETPNEAINFVALIFAQGKNPKNGKTMSFSFALTTDGKWNRHLINEF